jgi:RNA-directed DNA polymerase
MDSLEGTMNETSSSKNISTKLERIAKLAKEMPGAALTTLAHHIDIEWLKEAYRRTRKDGAPGVDGQTAQEYAAQLEENLWSLLTRAKRGDHYRAPPVRRVEIPKGDGRTRPIGIPTFEDKVLQRAVAMVLEAIYEQEFLDCSYGFRPGRRAHEAIEAVREHAMQMRGGWVLEADIEAFFDSVDHAKLREILSQRVRDGVLLRLMASRIERWGDGWAEVSRGHTRPTQRPKARTSEPESVPRSRWLNQTQKVGLGCPSATRMRRPEVGGAWRPSVTRPR